MAVDSNLVRLEGACESPALGQLTRLFGQRRVELFAAVALRIDGRIGLVGYGSQPGSIPASSGAGGTAEKSFCGHCS